VNEPSLPPGPRLPRLAQTARWMVRPGAFLTECRKRYGDTFTVKIANEGTWTFLVDPADVKAVFTGDPAIMHAGEANVILRPFVGSSSVLLLDDKPHLRQRKLMLPAFHGERMTRYGELMREIAETELASWPAGEPLSSWRRMQHVTLQIIIRAIFGVTDPAHVARMQELLSGMLDSSTNIRFMAALAVLGPDRAESRGLFRKQLEPVDRAIAEEIARHREDPRLDERDDILAMLLQARDEDGAPMSDTEIRDELMTLLIAGHETTATSLAWALERLGRNPAAWERLRDEVAAGEDEYLDAVIKETLRIRPVLPMVLRKLTQDFELPGGRVMPAGASLAPCIYLMHRRADIYPDPYAFRPERFLERPAGTYTWIPFGGGIRRCLGASFAQFEMKTVLAAVARLGNIGPGPGGPETIVRRAITLTPSRGGEIVPAPTVSRAPVPVPA
jgi:cytochrome P450 family 135